MVLISHTKDTLFDKLLKEEHCIKKNVLQIVIIHLIYGVKGFALHENNLFFLASCKLLLTATKLLESTGDLTLENDMYYFHDHFRWHNPKKCTKNQTFKL